MNDIHIQRSEISIHNSRSKEVFEKINLGKVLGDIDNSDLVLQEGYNEVRESERMKWEDGSNTTCLEC